MLYSSLYNDMNTSVQHTWTNSHLTYSFIFNSLVVQFVIR